MAEYLISGNRCQAAPLPAGLYVVATPIGNLGDVTVRGLETLAAADWVACEDKRVSTRLLKRYGIRTRLTVYNEHNAEQSGAEIIARVERGESVALITDAGTPLISDPGYRLVRDMRARGQPVWPVPGPSAAIAALSASGIPSHHFHFEGFLPSRSKARSARLGELALFRTTLIFYESPNRTAECLADIAEKLGRRQQVCVFREITKIYEQAVSGPAEEIAKRFAADEPKGEVVILVAPPTGNEPDADALLRQLLKRTGVAEAAAEAAELTGLSKRQLYQRALAIKRRKGDG